MAIQTAGTHFLCRNVLEGKDLTLVSASVDVFLARPMTSLATLPLGSFLAVQGGYEVRRSLVVLVEILSGRVLVAALAHFGTNIERRVSGPLVSLGFLRIASIAPARFGWNERSEETKKRRPCDTHSRETVFEQSQSSPRFRSANEPTSFAFADYGGQNKTEPVKNARFR